MNSHRKDDGTEKPNKIGHRLGIIVPVRGVTGYLALTDIYVHVWLVLINALLLWKTS